MTGLPCPQKLGLDEACLRISSHAQLETLIWHQFLECEKCNATLWARLAANTTTSLLVDSAYPTYHLYTKNDTSDKFYCLTISHFEEHAVYDWNLSDGSCSDVKRITGPSTSAFYLPFVILLVVTVLTSVLTRIAWCVYWRLLEPRVQHVSSDEIQDDREALQARDSSPSNEVQSKSRWRPVTTRLQSLDTFRGLCITLMIFVNYGGGQYRFFRHTPWNGMTIADIIFPWFLWAMGMSLILSLRSQLRSNRSRLAVWFSVLRRSMMLIVLGLLLNSFVSHKNDLLNFRFCGVLQRIGASFFIIASIETVFMTLQSSSQSGLFLDIADGWIQWICALALTGIWLLITLFVDVPNCGKGYLGPGGMHQHGNFFNCTGGAAGYIDRAIFHPRHIYQHPTSEKIYSSTTPYDPEGLLGTLTAAFLVHLGVNASRILLCFDHAVARISRWIVWGFICVLIGSMLCHWFSKDSGLIPINKNLFSLSFVLVTGGMAYFTFTFVYFVVDCKNWWSGAPFNYAGANSILLYVGHEITKKMFPFSWKPIYGTHTEFFFMNVLGTSLWIFISYLLYRNRFFVRI